MPHSAYIHIPFCKKKCKYCSFTSFATTNLLEKYLIALETEIRTRYAGESLSTLYFGGGTPSILKAQGIERLINLFNLSDDAEITLEANPCDVNYDYLLSLKSLGINRLSLGVQSFNDDILKIIGRRHDSAQAEKAVQLAQKVGFENISIDLIYGLPNQNLENLEADLRKALEINPSHISLYGLKIEPMCEFFNNPPEKLPDSDLQADMFEKISTTLVENGFNHYEISNFARDDKESRHNCTYWKNNEYYGFGCGAHGYQNSVRYSNSIKLNDYIHNPLQPSEKNTLTCQDALEEEIFLGFRLLCGLDVNSINEKFKIDFEKKYSKVLKKYLETQHIVKTQNGYKLSLSGILVSNVILADFLS